MHTTTIQIKKYPTPVWLTTVWLDEVNEIILRATGDSESSSKDAMLKELSDFQDNTTAKVQEALGKIKQSSGETQ